MRLHLLYTDWCLCTRRKKEGKRRRRQGADCLVTMFGIVRSENIDP